MADTERPIPPSSGRIAAAARAGLFPASSLLASGMSLFLCAGMGWLLAEPVLREAKALMSSSLQQAVSSGGVPATPSLVSAAAGVVVPMLLLLAVVFTGALVGAGIPALIARRRTGRTAVPLPKAPSGTLQMGVVRLLGAAVFVLIAVAALRGAVSDLRTDHHVLLAAVRTICQLTAVLGAILILLGLVEWTLRRHLILRALRLDTAEARRERRADEGEPRIKQRRLARARSDWR